MKKIINKLIYNLLKLYYAGNNNFKIYFYKGWVIKCKVNIFTDYNWKINCYKCFSSFEVYGYYPVFHEGIKEAKDIINKRERINNEKKRF